MDKESHPSDQGQVHQQSLNIKFTRTGGFIGVNESAEVRLTDLPGPERATFTQAVDESGILSGPAINNRNSRACDVFIYSLSVSDSHNHTYSATFDDTTYPSSYRPLVTLLMKRVKDNRNPGAHKQ